MTGMGTGFQEYEPFISSMAAPAAIILVTDGDNNRGANVVDVVREYVCEPARPDRPHHFPGRQPQRVKPQSKELAALNPNSIVVRGEELATSDAAVERFVLAVFCQEEDVIVLRGVHFAFDSMLLTTRPRAS